MNNTHLELLSSFPEESKCSGAFCDRQRCIELVRSRKSCGYYSMQNHLSSIVLCYDLNINYGSEHSKIITIDNFSSLRFTCLFLDNDLPGSMTCSSLDNTSAHEDLEDCINSIIRYVNDQG